VPVGVDQIGLFPEETADSELVVEEHVNTEFVVDTERVGAIVFDPTVAVTVLLTHPFRGSVTDKLYVPIELAVIDELFEFPIIPDPVQVYVAVEGVTVEEMTTVLDAQVIEALGVTFTIGITVFIPTAT
jgi:hypothetical protein